MFVDKDYGSGGKKCRRPVQKHSWKVFQNGQYCPVEIQTLPRNPRRAKKTHREEVSKDVSFHLQSKEKYKLERKDETKKIGTQWQVADDEVVEKTPPWESRDTRSQLQEKKEKKKE